MIARRALVLNIVLLNTCLRCLLAQETFVARVDGRAITTAEVNRVIQRALHGGQASGAALMVVQAQAIEQLIGQRLLAAELDRLGNKASPEEVEAGVTKVKAAAEAQGKLLSSLLGEQGLTMNSLREDLAWEIVWTKFSRQQMTDDRLEKFFEAHRAEYDGSEIRASHILLRPVAGSVSATTLEPLLQRAAQIRAEIAAGKITFAQAARRDSDGPSREQGGDLGYFPRHNRMVESFSAAAFALKPDEISQPVITSFGVHLIQRTGMNAGTKTWREVRGDLIAPATNDLFNTLAAELRPKAKVEYTGAMAHLDPATGRIVGPNATP
ncbi:MAG TPA: peptidylprolyl isomerase [Pirellulales bacterium]|nr:peptidylprolyl isomerase [Pirellulales bacterium]